MPNKNKAWADINNLSKNEDIFIKRGLASSIGHIFKVKGIEKNIKEQAWTILHKYIGDKDPYIKLAAVKSLGLAFADIPYKREVWEDLHNLALDKNDDVKLRAALSLGYAYSHLPEENKNQVIVDLSYLVTDDNKDVSAFANHSLGKIYINKFSHVGNNERQITLEKALKYFKIAQEESSYTWSNSSIFCYNLYTIIYNKLYTSKDRKEIDQSISILGKLAEKSQLKEQMVKIVSNLVTMIDAKRSKNHHDLDLEIMQEIENKCSDNILQLFLQIDENSAESFTKMISIVMDDYNQKSGGNMGVEKKMERKGNVGKKCSNNLPEWIIKATDELWINELSEPSPKIKVDIGIIIALPTEFDGLLPDMEKNCKSVYDKSICQWFHVFEYRGERKNPFRCVATIIGEMDSAMSALCTDELIRKFKPNLIANIGISGSLDSSVLLGDVVVADVVDQYLYRSKILDDKLEFSGGVYRVGRNFLSHANNIQTPEHKNSFKKWENNAKDRVLKYFGEAGFNNYHEKKFIADIPKLHIGSVASGPSVIASSKFKLTLKEHNRTYLAVEMESAGVLMAAKRRDINSLVIRGISDFSDKRKKILEDKSQGYFRIYAMKNALSLLWILLAMDIPDK